jgi:hypothetical protein
MAVVQHALAKWGEPYLLAQLILVWIDRENLWGTPWRLIGERRPQLLLIM